MQLSRILTGDPRLCTGVEVEGAALRLCEPPADGDVVLLPAASGEEASDGVGQLEAAVLVGDEDFKSCLDVFVESFEQSDAEDILHHHVV